jgi:hypothetical protein
MRKVMPSDEFLVWVDGFLPGLKDKDFQLAPGKVSDRSDGKLVHLAGLNFSRAWVMYGLARDFPEKYGHLAEIANQHIRHSLPAIVDEDDEGTHWSGTFAVFALQEAK